MRKPLEIQQLTNHNLNVLLTQKHTLAITQRQTCREDRFPVILLHNWNKARRLFINIIIQNGPQVKNAELIL